MKIGILTWFYGHNYGAQLHSFALQQTVENMGHECIMISFYPKELTKKNILMNLNYKDRKKHPILALRCLKRNYNFLKTRNLIFNQSKRVHSAAEIDELQCDLIILGSDEVFKPTHPFFDKIFYGVGIKTPCITYAPSAGQTDCDFILQEDIVQAIKNYRALSVRDSYTQQLIRNNTGLTPQIVLDPTLIYDFKGFSFEFPEKKYLLVYSFDTYDEYANRIRDYANKNGLKVVSIGRYCAWADRSYDYISAKRWVGAFEKAEVVVTDSFHGTVFSIKNRKPLVVIGRVDKTNKISALLNDCHIELPYYDGKEPMERYFDEHTIDYDEVEAIMQQKRDESLEYLRSAIANSMEVKNN